MQNSNSYNFKVAHRAHYSKTKLAKIYPNLVDACDRCSLAPCNLTHMFWSCPKVVEYWKKYFKVISEILDQTIEPSPHIAIFGVPEAFVFSAKQATVTSFTSSRDQERQRF